MVLTEQEISQIQKKQQELTDMTDSEFAKQCNVLVHFGNETDTDWTPETHNNIPCVLLNEFNWKFNNGETIFTNLLLSVRWNGKTEYGVGGSRGPKNDPKSVIRCYHVTDRFLDRYDWIEGHYKRI